MFFQAACREYKVFILRLVVNFSQLTVKTLLYQIPFKSKSAAGLYELFENGCVGRIKSKENPRAYKYFITYRGRKFLADNGDKVQLKYLNLQIH